MKKEKFHKPLKRLSRTHNAAGGNDYEVKKKIHIKVKKTEAFRSQI
jgi:hypothetical protein